MAYANGQISAPVDASDPYYVMGVGQYNGTFDVGHICGNTHGKINKWSKRKPIVYDTIEELTTAQFKGMSGDNAIGIIYGLKAMSVVGDIGQMHSADYTYYPPSTTDWKRLTDFIGYDHKAVPTLNMLLVPDIIFYNDRPSVRCAIDYDDSGSNTTGIDIEDFLPSGDVKTIADYYPCILVDNYAVALYNIAKSSTQNKVFTPLKHEGIWQQNFGCDFDTSPLNQISTARQVTFFLIRSISSVNWPLETWQPTGVVSGTERGIAIPNGINLNLPVKYRTDVVALSIGGVSYANNKVDVYWSILDEIVSTKFNISVVIRDISDNMLWSGNIDVTRSQGR